MLYLDTNDNNNLKFAGNATWFGRELTDDPVATERGVKLQEISEKIRRVRYLLQETRIDYGQNAAEVNALWQEIGDIVKSDPQFAGASVEQTQSVPDIAVATNSPSRKPSKKKE